jgi:hypothetical protein
MTNATPHATPKTSDPIVASEAQPQSLPLLSARMIGPRVRATRIVPAKSMDRDRFGSRDSGLQVGLQGGSRGTRTPGHLLVRQVL